MYEVDDEDTIKKLVTVPHSSVGAPLPMLLSDEYSTLVAYIIEERDPEWDGTTLQVVDAHSGDQPVAIVRFVGPVALMLGQPNDEAFSGHPLASRGLSPYGSFEVLNSSWIRGLERMNRVHPYHCADRYRELRHFVLSFHDSTFECVADDVRVVETLRGSMTQAVLRMTELIVDHTL